jgi:hypothetical protein
MALLLKENKAADFQITNKNSELVKELASHTISTI